tara:strand:+ start:51 stop:194 length:144 start_codon:yes stop_codon:yes gene_type:complete
MTEWNMTSSQKESKFFDDTKDELENKIINLENKIDEIIKLLEELKND